jgi:hypothetical protein
MKPALGRALERGGGSVQIGCRSHPLIRASAALVEARASARFLYRSAVRGSAIAPAARCRPRQRAPGFVVRFGWGCLATGPLEATDTSGLMGREESSGPSIDLHCAGAAGRSFSDAVASSHAGQIAYKEFRSFMPSGTPQPVAASKPGPALYPLPGLGLDALLPEEISRDAILPTGTPAPPF